VNEIVTTNLDGSIIDAALAAFFRPTAQPRVKPRGLRLPSLAKVQRDNPGKRVTVTYRTDGSRSFTIDEKPTPPDAEVNEWDIDLGASSPSAFRQ
jgi:hypothetical protein